MDGGPRRRRANFDVSHIPERYGLFTIIVLGEAIIAVARSMSEAQWTPEAVTTAIAGFAIAVVIWWAYFAHPHAELLERGRLASFIWGYGHIFVWMGIAITGSASSWRSKPPPPGTRSDGERLILCGGPALYLVAMALLRRRAPAISRIVVVVRLATAVAFIVIWLAGGRCRRRQCTVLMAAVAVGAGVVIGRAWRSIATPVG